MEAIEVLHWRVQKVPRDKITLQGGQEMRRLQVPRVVVWSPDTEFARIALFKVWFQFCYK